jgi:cytochrome P450
MARPQHPQLEYRPFPNEGPRNWRQEHLEIPLMLRTLDIPRGGRVLEVGCGRGIALPALARNLKPARLVGIDIDPALLVEAGRRLLGDGLLTSEGDAHRSQRRRVQPVFARERLHAYAGLVPELTANHVARWATGDRVRLGSEMDELAMKIVARVLLGANIESQVPALGKALQRLARWAPLLAAPGGRSLERSRLPVLGRLRAAIETVEAAIDCQIADGGADAPLLGALLHSGSGPPMLNRLVRDEVMTIFLAGHDTTAAALTWTWLLLGGNPVAESRLHAELSSVLGPRRPQADDLERLPYTAMVVKEALRLYPPIGRIGRRPIREVDLGLVVLPKDAAVFLSPFVTQRDPRWFVNPDQFCPERWLEPVPDRPRFAWFPFGAGPRSCIGEHFAMGVLVLAIATMAKQCRLIPTAAGFPRSRSLLTVKPRGAVWVNVQSR